MTTPTSLLGMSHIQTEFGGSNPIALSEYYGVNANVAASGTIRMAQFLGISSGPPVVLVSNDILSSDLASAEARATWFANGASQYASIGGDSGFSLISNYTWLISGSAANYQIRATKTAGVGNAPTFSSGWANNTFAAMSSDRYVSVSQTINGLSWADIAITVRYASNSVTIASTTLYMEAFEK